MVLKKKVKYSTGSVLYTSIALLFLVAMFFYFMGRRDIWCYVPLYIVITGWCVAALFYAPIAVEAGEKGVDVYRPLRVKHIPYSEIKDVKMCPPTMAEKLLFGSSGGCGYWGWHSEKDLGRYFAYYGKASEAFLVTLKDGRKYMLGCVDAPEMAEAVKARLQ